MEASGKKVSGGLYKFDASEVDINGGTAAGDFMDAFGLAMGRVVDDAEDGRRGAGGWR